MAYTKTSWVNGSAPALSAENLNKIEEGIYNNDAAISAIKFESGTEGDWSYRKYADGTFEAWINVPYNVALQTAAGALYTSASAIQVTLPTFSDMSGWVVFCTANGGEFVRINSKTATQDPPYFTFYPTSVSSRAATARTASFYVKGTWS